MYVCVCIHVYIHKNAYDLCVRSTGGQVQNKTSVKSAFAHTPSFCVNSVLLVLEHVQLLLFVM